MPYLRTLAIDHVALLLARSWEYHVPLGVAGLLMYVQPHWAAALAAQPLVRELTASGRVALVLWEGFAGYDGWIDYDLQVRCAALRCACAVLHMGCGPSVRGERRV